MRKISELRKKIEETFKFKIKFLKFSKIKIKAPKTGTMKVILALVLSAVLSSVSSQGFSPYRQVSSSLTYLNLIAELVKQLRQKMFTKFCMLQSRIKANKLKYR